MKTIFLVCMLTLVSMVMGSNYANASDLRFNGCDDVMDATVDAGIEEIDQNVFAVMQLRPMGEGSYVYEVNPFFSLRTPAYDANGKLIPNQCKMRGDVIKRNVGRNVVYQYNYYCNSRPDSIRVLFRVPVRGNSFQSIRECKLFTI